METRPLLALVRVIAAMVVLVALGSDIASQAGDGSHELVTTLSYSTVQSNLVIAGVTLSGNWLWERRWSAGPAVVTGVDGA